MKQTMDWLSYFFVIAAGFSSAVQTGANAQLRKSVGQPFLAALYVYGIALIPLIIAVALERRITLPASTAQTRWWAWMGGPLSILSTMAGMILAQRMGSLFFTATAVTCSLICGVLLDHLGWVGFEVHRANPGRLIGCVLLVAGVFLVSKF